MESLRDLRKRLRAVKNNRKITKAMKMIAASKLRRAQQAILEARPFAQGMEEVLEHVVARADLQAHPLLAYRETKVVELLVLSANRGLCGGFNANIMRAAEQFMAKEQRLGVKEFEVSTLGKKARDHFRRRGHTLRAEYETAIDKVSFEEATEIATDLANRFRESETDAVYLVYNEFKSAISQKVTVQQLLPIRSLDQWKDTPAARVGEMASVSGNLGAVAGRSMDVANLTVGAELTAGFAGDNNETGEDYEHIYEPSRSAILDTLLPQHLGVKLFRAVLESNAAEHGARMSAMDAATRNASEIIDAVALQMNRVRQASITNELMEIVSGAEAIR
jgi:F-type H+-transporting ATPase subunit gamma